MRDPARWIQDSVRFRLARRAGLAITGGKRIDVRRFAGHCVYAEQLARPLRVVHLTDLHIGRMTPLAVHMSAIELANKQRPDLVVITGDFVCHGQAYLDRVYEVVSRIEAPVVGVLGNHDHLSGAGEVRETLLLAGVELIDNASTVVTLGGQRLQLVGLGDAHTGHADLAHAIRGLRRDLPTLGLSHIAEEAEGLWRAGVPLVLSGHTHGGQFSLGGINEWLMGRVAGHRYVHGLYGSRSEPPPQGAVYVSAGIGAAVMPLRVGARARREVAVFELGLLPGSFVEPDSERAGHQGRPTTERTMSRRAARVAPKSGPPRSKVPRLVSAPPRQAS